jgi:hypothetical protein
VHTRATVELLPAQLQQSAAVLEGQVLDCIALRIINHVLVPVSFSDDPEGHRSVGNHLELDLVFAHAGKRSFRAYFFVDVVVLLRDDLVGHVEEGSFLPN